MGGTSRETVREEMSPVIAANAVTPCAERAGYTPSVTWARPSGGHISPASGRVARGRLDGPSASSSLLIRASGAVPCGAGLSDFLLHFHSPKGLVGLERSRATGSGVQRMAKYVYLAFHVRVGCQIRSGGRGYY